MNLKPLKSDIKFIEVKSWEIVVAFLLFALFAMIALYFDAINLHMLTLFFLIVGIIIPLLQRNLYIAKVKNGNLLLKSNLLTKTKRVRISEIEKVVMDKLIDEAYKLKFILFDNSVVEFQVDVKYRHRLVDVVDLLYRHNFKIDR